MYQYKRFLICREINHSVFCRNLGRSALIIMHFPLSFCKNASPCFFHGAFAPSFIWSRCPCRPLRSIGFTVLRSGKASTRYTLYSIMSITLQRYLTQKHKLLHTVHLAYIFTMQVLRRLGAKPLPQTPANSAYACHPMCLLFLWQWGY